MSQWTDEDPGRGDGAGLRARGRAMETIVRQLDRARAEVRDARDDLEGWRGTAGDAHRAQLDEWLSEADDLIDTLAPYSGALVTYGSVVEDIAAEVSDLDRRSAAAFQDVVAADRVLTAFPAPGLVVSAGRLRRARQERADARAVLTGVERSKEELADRRRTADRQVLDVLDRSVRSSWAEVGAALEEVGLARPRELTADAVQSRVLSLTDLVREGGAAMNSELFALLNRWADDAVFMDGLCRSLGGDGLVALLGALDAQAVSGRSARAADVQRRLRDGVAAASALWSPEEAAAVAREMVGTRNAPSAVAFLFGDPVGAPMSGRFAGATADAIRDGEVDRGQLFALRTTDRPPGMGAVADYWPLGEGMHVVDPASQVLAHLALDPRGALDWLAGDKRAEYWYGVRRWEDGGGFVAPMRLWEAAQAVPGAVLGRGAADPQLERRLARVNARVIEAWVGREYAGFMDAAARVALAGVVAVQLPIWLETTLVGDPRARAEARDDRNVLWLGDTGHGWTVAPSRDALARLLAQVTPDAGASGRLLAAVRQLQLDLLNSVATAEQTGAPMTHDAVLQRIAALHGAVDGARLANELSTAAMQDATVRALVGAAGLAAGELAGPAGLAGGIAVSAGEDAAESAWAQNYDRALAELWAGEGAAEERKQQVRSVLGGLVSDWVPPEAVPGQSAEQYLDGVMNNYEDKRGYLDSTKVP